MRRNAAIACLLLIGTLPVQAGNYRFSVPRAEVTVTIEPEGSALIHYALTFECSRGAHPIDVVDIGMPTQKHKPVSAAIDGRPLLPSSIRPSKYVDNAYEILLGGGAIRPGHEGVFEFTARSRGMVWQDTTDPGMASFRFTPTWFDAKFVSGKTHLVLRYKLPPGEYPEPDKTIIWHKGTPRFTVKGVLEGETAPSVTWTRSVSLTGPHVFGVSFPKAYVTNVKKMGMLRLLHRWFKGNTDARIVSAMIVIVLFAAVFFLSTRGTGCALFVVGLAGLAFVMYRSDVAHLCLYPVLLGLAVASLLYRRSAKKHYVPAKISRPGGTVSTGLTAVEAAVLLDEPVEKILTILIFEMARRKLVAVEAGPPMKVAVQGRPYKTGWRSARR